MIKKILSLKWLVWHLLKHQQICIWLELNCTFNLNCKLMLSLFDIIVALLCVWKFIYFIWKCVCLDMHAFTSMCMCLLSHSCDMFSAVFAVSDEKGLCHCREVVQNEWAELSSLRVKKSTNLWYILKVHFTFLYLQVHDIWLSLSPNLFCPMRSKE